MLGAIIGDIQGSSLEFFNKYKTIRPTTFTDDSILTLGTAFSLLNPPVTYGTAYRQYFDKYLEKQILFGKNFKTWMSGPELNPYGGFGNGSAMRVSPIAHYFGSIEEVLSEAEKSASCSHNHAEGIEGAKAIALAVFLALRGKSKEEIKNAVEGVTSYKLSRPYESLTVSSTLCIDSVPNAIICFLNSQSLAEAMSLAIALEGDTDTVSSMAAAMGEGFYGITASERCIAKIHLPKDEFKLIEDFYEVCEKRRSDSRRV